MILLFYVDAFRYDLFNKQNTPFLYSLLKYGQFSELIPSFGFEPDRAIFFGLYPEAYNGGMHFRFSKNSPYNLDKISILDIPSIRKYLNKIITYYIKKKSDIERIKRTATIAYIPFRFMKYFDFTEKEMPLEFSDIKGRKSIINILKEKYNFEYLGYPYNKVNIDKYTVNDLLKNDTNCAFIYIHQLDGISHEFGPESKEANLTLQKIDNFIKDLSGKYIKNNLDLFVFGDHGMAEIKEKFDIMEYLIKLPIKPEKDYLYFIDSVFARFWFFNDRAKRIVTNFLKTLKSGYIIDEQMRKTNKINYLDHRFGEIIFVANCGTEFYPNFWNIKKNMLGMHGYDRKCNENHTLFFYYNNAGRKIKIKDISDSTDVYSYLKQTIG